MLKRRLFLTALIFWFCVLMINLIRRPVSDNAVLRDVFMAEKISWKNRFDLVVTGDSRTMTGISPQAMQSVLPGNKIGNLGFMALAYSQEYMDYIRMTLRPPVKNRIIVIGFTPRSLLSHGKRECFFRKWSKETRIPLKMELNRHSGWLQTLFRELVIGDLDLQYFNSDRQYLSVCFESGWVASRLFPERAKASRAEYSNLFMNDKINEELLEVIYRNTEAWTREGIKVFGIRMPISPGLFALENKMSGFAEPNIKQMFERRGGIWLSPDISYFVAYDGSHARYDSAISYSRSLAEELKKFLDEKR